MDVPTWEQRGPHILTYEKVGHNVTLVIVCVAALRILGCGRGRGGWYGQTAWASRGHF